jgi:hypothetical protein
MNVWTKVLVHIAMGAVAISCVQAGALPALAQQAAASPTAADKNGQAQPTQAPSSAQSPAADSQNAGQQPAAAPPAPQPAPTDALPQAPEPQTVPSPQKPVGTATAETPNVSGVAASQPAGIAMAPAKQRRVRTIVFKVGAIVGAGVAVGTVVALTRATPSKPPGAH